MATTEWQLRGKETSPEKTVERIKEILGKHGFAYEYNETKSGIGECYSSRLALVPPGAMLIGTNGKGMSRELCAASAFGELMERMSNAALVGLNSQDPMREEIRGDRGTYYSVYSEEQPDCIQRLKNAILKTMPDMDPASQKLLLDMTLCRLCGDRDEIPTYPYYSFGKKKVEYLPADLIRLFTGSNGMAAGNTIAEALVEGLSEIFERYVEEKALKGGVRLTRLPDEVLKKYPHIASLVSEIERDKDKTVILMDASLGKHFPVLCGICISKNTGKAGVKFGAHPNMAVAMERIFTEGTQGRDLEAFARLNSFIFQNKDSVPLQRVEHWNILKTGIGRMPAELLMPYSADHYEPWTDYTGESNASLARKMIELLESIGGDVYIRDTSVFGFPAVQIYASGISEVHEKDWTTLSILDAVTNRDSITAHLDRADDREIQSLSLISGIRPVVLGNEEYSYLLGVPMKYKMPGGNYQSIFLKGMCEFYLGNISEADGLIRQVVTAMGETADNALEKVISAYLSGSANGFDKEEIRAYLSNLYPDYCDRVCDIMSDPKAVFSKLYPICNGFDCENCRQKKICVYPDIRNIKEKIGKAYNGYMPTEEQIASTFQDLK